MNSMLFAAVRPLLLCDVDVNFIAEMIDAEAEEESDDTNETESERDGKHSEKDLAKDLLDLAQACEVRLHAVSGFQLAWQQTHSSGDDYSQINLPPPESL